ncbi:hypothetical protein ACIBP6_37440 [Nonomuraea terrae]|uniref:hypothetical protein n=1 Tax=Nonomuraea terrae TaxID=2530383 RepID=UPI00379711C3
MTILITGLHHPETLNQAFEGVDTVWLLVAMARLHTRQQQRRLGGQKGGRAAHRPHVAIGAGHDAPTRNGRLHVLSDIELAASGLGWTVIRPSFVMQNALGSVDGDTFYGAPGQRRVSMIDVRDIADFATVVIRDPAPHQGGTYPGAWT